MLVSFVIKFFFKIVLLLSSSGFRPYLAGTQSKKKKIAHKESN